MTEDAEVTHPPTEVPPAETPRFLVPAAGVWILTLDWLLFSSNVISAGVATPLIVGGGFLLGGAGTFLIQWKSAGDPVWIAALKALVAGLVVGAPWPVGGTLLGGWVLLASGLGKK